MKLDNIILSSNLNDNYIQFWPLVSIVWEKTFGIKPTLGLLADINPDSKFVNDCKNYGDVIIIKPDYTYDLGIQAKVTRLFLASKLNGNSILGDIDLLPLNIQKFKTLLSAVPDNTIVSFGANAYKRTLEHFKVPMCYLSASRETFQKLTNVNESTSFQEFLKMYENPIETINPELTKDKKTFISKTMDRKESTLNTFDKFSDESLLRFLVYNSGLEDLQFKISRDLFHPERIPTNKKGIKSFVCTYSDRIDRVGDKLVRRMFTPSLLEYTDVHGVRPYQKYISEYIPVLKELKIDPKETIPPSFKFGDFINNEYYISLCKDNVVRSMGDLLTLEIEEDDVIYIECDLVHSFLSNFSNSTTRFKLIISDVMSEKLEKFDIYDISRLQKMGASEIYIIDTEIEHPKVTSLPIGFFDTVIQSGDLHPRSNFYNLYRRLKPLSDRKRNAVVFVPEVYVLKETPKKEEVLSVYEKISDYSFCYISPRVSRNFVYECIALGCIPIVDNGFISKLANKKLPIVFTDDIASLRASVLVDTFTYYKTKPELFNTNPVITKSYWTKKILCKK